MNKRQWFVGAGLILVCLLFAVPARAQVIPCSGSEISKNLPPAGSPPLVRCIEVVFHPEGTQSVDSETYNYYIKPLEPSLRSQNKWVQYNEEQALGAFSRLMRTTFLDDCWVEVIDEPYRTTPHAIHREEWQPEGDRYIGSKKVEISKIEEALKEKSVNIRFDVRGRGRDSEGQGRHQGPTRRRATNTRPSTWRRPSRRAD
jgi:hypothetical protein